ncbi:ABC transporter ATP-binding protein [Nitrospina watsonii]|uniref:Lipid A export ATP-binding/permease protein MsbA n=1 Tax=Nitrospina watsonii TaxID=1323948 RepID=A0ABM9HE58_9BACT|nr:ABC transporter ATP-binding protein [Nitrospina watsonii]CAI2718440.1 Lipid A export ATP-binding/permease protein MsbA [Nitrospina watsonii]
MKKATIYQRLVHYLLPYKGKVILTLLTSVLVGALSTSPVPLVQQTFDKIFVEKDYFMLKMLPLIVIALYLTKGVLRYIQSVIIFQIGWELVAKIRLEMFQHIHKLPYGFFEKDTTGQLMSRLVNDVNAMLLSLTKYIKDTIQSVVMFIGLLFWVFWLKWDWALIAIFVIPVALVPTGMVARKLRKLGRRGQELLADINSTMLESISGIKVVRAFGLEEQEDKKLERHNDEFLKIMKKDVRYTEFTSPMMEVLAVLGGSVVLWLGGFEVLEGEITQGAFFAFVLGMFMMYDPMRILFKTYTDSQKAVAAAERVFSVLDTEEEKANDGTLDLTEFQDRIEYRNVGFKYPTRDTMVLSDINLTVKKSEVLAIVGMSGAGKTTLVDLLFKFFNVTQGEILIDGVNINDISSQSLRRNLALVTQETFLFNDTIWANIGYGNPDATKDDIVRAAKAAHVDTYVQALDDGYDTVIGERGLKLSGGQRQRIAIARAIVRNAPILVLDEATSALDSESEKLVQDALNNLMEHRTTFVIAHRFSTIKHADRIIVMEHGKMVGQGNHEQLLEQCPQYQKYYEMQIIGSA